jgi:hypothetical protein
MRIRQACTYTHDENSLEKWFGGIYGGIFNQ